MTKKMPLFRGPQCSPTWVRHYSSLLVIAFPDLMQLQLTVCDQLYTSVSLQYWLLSTNGNRSAFNHIPRAMRKLHRKSVLTPYRVPPTWKRAPPLVSGSGNPTAVPACLQKNCRKMNTLHAPIPTAWGPSAPKLLIYPIYPTYAYTLRRKTTNFGVVTYICGREGRLCVWGVSHARACCANASRGLSSMSKFLVNISQGSAPTVCR